MPRTDARLTGGPLGKCPAALFVAFFETPSFSFMAAGETEKEARAALAKAWGRHARATGADADYFSQDSARVERLEAGKAYRDWEEI